MPLPIFGSAEKQPYCQLCPDDNVPLANTDPQAVCRRVSAHVSLSQRYIILFATGRKENQERISRADALRRVRMDLR